MIKESLIDIEPKHLVILKKIFKLYIPSKTVWAYGSRITWTANTKSDLDIIVFDVNSKQINNLKDALAESDLPFSVDVMNWEKIPETFKENIQKKYVVLQDKADLDDWKECKLGEVVEINKNSINSDFNHEKILYLDTGSITQNRIENLQEVELKKAPSRARRLVKKDDIIYSTVRPNQLHYGYITKPQDNLVVSTGFAVIESNRIKIIPKYLYYLLIQNEITEYLHSIAEASTSAYPSLKPSDIESLDILLPPLSEQRAIASVLSSLDDKIDLLHKQNETLEAMAETLFRQWFVEDADNNLKEKPLFEFGEIVCGKTPSKKNTDYFGGNIPFIKIPDMHNNTFVFSTLDTLTEIGKLSQSNKTLPPKSICVSCIATVGLVSLNAYESQTNQQINSIIPKKEYYRYFLYLSMKSHVELLKAMASGGTATPNLNTGDFSKITISYSEDNIIKFDKEVNPLFNKIYFNQTQIRTLEKLRDTLLPKLMSGEVRVAV